MYAIDFIEIALEHGLAMVNITAVQHNRLGKMFAIDLASIVIKKIGYGRYALNDRFCPLLPSELDTLLRERVVNSECC